MSKEQQIEFLSNMLYYGIFKKPISFSNAVKLKKVVPQNCFGVFSTIKRHKKLKKWPKDIHGCMGYWDDDYKKISKDRLLEHSMRVTHNAINDDNRRSYFEPLENDPNSLLEIDFLMKPLLPIDPKTGTLKYKHKIIKYNNNKFGIIIQGGQNRATFLPHVFPNKSWENILKLLLNKGNIRKGDKYTLYAYEIIQYKMPIIQLLKYRDFLKSNVQSFNDLLFKYINHNKKYGFFYNYNINTNKYQYDDTQDVRNCALLGSLYLMNKKGIIKLTKTSETLLKKKALILLKNISKLSSQALSFLSPFITNNKKGYCEKLIKDLPSAEENFEKPEILIGLKISGCQIPKFEKLNCLVTDNIFKFNWTIQANYFLYNKFPPILLKYFEKKIRTLLSTIKENETNHLAVALEALCYVYNITKEEIWLELLYPIFIELEKRKKGLNILYAFKNDNCRVDISDHIYRGFSVLWQSM